MVNVVLDAVGSYLQSAPSQNSSPFTYSGITVGSGANRGLVITLGFWGIGSSFPGGIGITWDSGGTNQAMTLLGSFNTNTSTMAFFGLTAPTSGNKNASISWSSGATPAQTGVAALSFTNVGGFSNYSQNTGSSTTASITVASAPGHYLLAMADQTTTALTAFSAPNQTSLYNDPNSANYNAAQYAAGAGSVTFQWTNSNNAWSVMAVDVNPTIERMGVLGLAAAEW